MILVQYSIVQYSIVQYSIGQHSIVQESIVQLSIVQYSMVQYSIVQHTRKYSSIVFQYSILVQYSSIVFLYSILVQYSIVQYTHECPFQYSIVQYSRFMIRFMMEVLCNIPSNKLAKLLNMDHLQMLRCCRGSGQMNNRAARHSCWLMIGSGI